MVDWVDYPAVLYIHIFIGCVYLIVIMLYNWSTRRGMGSLICDFKPGFGAGEPSWTVRHVQQARGEEREKELINKRDGN